MKKKVVINNLEELKEKLNMEYLLNNTCVFHSHDADIIARSLGLWLQTWVSPLIDNSLKEIKK